jgi:hypothetical protein
MFNFDLEFNKKKTLEFLIRFVCLLDNYFF